MVDTNNDGEYNPADYVDQTTTRININFGPTMQNNLAAMQTVQRAAEFWSTALADDVTVTIDAEFAALGEVLLEPCHRSWGICFTTNYVM